MAQTKLGSLVFAEALRNTKIAIGSKPIVISLNDTELDGQLNGDGLEPKSAFVKIDPAESLSGAATVRLQATFTAMKPSEIYASAVLDKDGKVLYASNFTNWVKIVTGMNVRVTWTIVPGNTSSVSIS